MSNLKEEFADFIKDTLREKNISQRELGVKLGKDETTISRLLSGRQNLTIETIQKIQEAIGVEFQLFIKKV